MMERYRGISIQARASLWYTVCDALNKGVTFLVIPVYLRLMTTAEYGKWSVFQSWRDILIIFASMNLYAGVFTKKLVDLPEGERDRFTSCMQGLNVVITGALFLVWLLLREPAARLLELDVPQTLLLFGYFLTYPAYLFWMTRQRVEYRYKNIAAATVVATILVPGLSLLLLTQLQTGASAVIYGFLIAQNLIGLPFFILHFIRGKAFYDRETWTYAFRFNAPLIPHYVSLIALGQADRIMIKEYCGESDAGIYSFAYQIALAVGVLVSAINGSRVPWTYERLRDREYGKIRPVATLLCVMMGLVTGMVCLLSPAVIAVFGTAEYQQAVWVIPVVTLATYITFIYDLFCGIEFYYGATKYVMIASSAGAVLNILLNALLIPRFGFIAAAYTTLASYLALMLAHWLFMRRVLREQKITEKVYDSRAIFLICGAVSAVAFASMLTYHSVWLQVGFLLILAGLCWWKKDLFLRVMKDMKKGA